MTPQAGHPVDDEPVPPARDAVSDYSRLLARLASRAKSLGSRDPEGAAQEALKRSLENSGSHAAVEYYFGPVPAAGANLPEWPLDQLFAWLHAVLRNVIREEQGRVGFQREVRLRSDAIDASVADPAPNQLDALIDKELQAIVMESFGKLADEYRNVLRMRNDGLKYSEIASRLGVNENTVATWVSRAIRDLAQRVRRRMAEGR